MITSPTEPSVWYVGETNRKITWNETGNIPAYKIDYKVGAGSWTRLIGSTPGTNNEYTWPSIPGTINSEEVLVRVMDADTTNHPDVIKEMTTQNYFSIRPKIFVGDVTEDGKYNEGGILGLRAGKLYTNIVKWTYTGSTIQYVKIYYDDDNNGTFDEVIDDTGNVAVTAGATARRSPHPQRD